MRGPVTVGVDVGTTSVKALAVDADGQVIDRVRVPHRISTPGPDRLEHDARLAWRKGPRRAFGALAADLAAPIAGVAVASMVPSLTAVDGRGIPQLPGLLYGDARGAEQPAADGGGTSNGGDAERFIRWASSQMPAAMGYWPCQAVASYALSGLPVMDSAVSSSFGALYSESGWDVGRLASLGARPEQMATVVPLGQPGGVIPGSDTVIAGGLIDALCDQLVAGATEPGDVLAIFGATLVVWIVSDEWVEVPGLFTVPHTHPGRVLIGGPSNAGALFVDWARKLLRVPAPGPAAKRSRAFTAADTESDGRAGAPSRVPVWLPYLRGERSPFNDPMLRASVHGLDITQGPAAIERAAYEASGFVIRRMLERTGIEGRRVVASGGGTKVGPWMAGVADATGLPVDAVAVSEGAAYGAAFVARLAAGLEPSLGESQRWARTGRRFDASPEWARAADVRYRRFEQLGPGT